MVQYDNIGDNWDSKLIYYSPNILEDAAKMVTQCQFKVMAKEIRVSF